jgi:transcriptional regulator with XRE-family HTH domain
MRAVRTNSDIAPADEGRASYLWWELLSGADGIGLISPGVSSEGPDLDLLQKLLERLDQAGVAKALIVRLRRIDPSDTDRTTELIRGVLDALRASPLPEFEWKSLTNLFAAEELAGLLKISESSLNRYASGTRRTPDVIAERLHFLALIVGDLRGAYNDVGIRRWWQRPRTALDGDTPAEHLESDWTPDDPGARAVRDLAHSLLFASAT